MPDLQNFLLFALAALMLNITPGNDMIFVISRSLSYGIKAGVYADWASVWVVLCIFLLRW